MGRLPDKVAIVTGGSQGIGFSIARACAQEGASVLLTGRDPDKLEHAAAQLRMIGGEVEFVTGTAGVRADAEKVVAAAIERFGRLDILVNNAQTQIFGAAFENVDDETIDANVRSGLYGTVHHMQAAFPHLKERGGSIINIGSRAGIYGAPGFLGYAATKEGIRGLSRVAAREWGQYRIRVNVLCPVAISPTAAQYLAEHAEEHKELEKNIALGRMGDASEDIAPVAVFLASSDSQYVTGQTINADGGQVML